MNPNTNRRSIERQQGGSILNPGRNDNHFYMLPITWGSGIAPGGSATTSVKTDAGYAFSVLSLTGELRDNTTNARLDLANDFPQLLLTFSVNDGSWQSGEVPYSTIVGTGPNPFFPLFAPTIGAAMTVNVTARNTNAAGATVRPFINLVGVRFRI